MVVIEILEVHLEEMDLFLHFLENDLIMPVVLSYLENCGKKELIQSTNLVDIAKNYVRLFFVNDLPLE